MKLDDAETTARTHVRAILEQLPANQRQVIELTLVAGLTQRAIAAQLKCDEAEVPRLAQLSLQTIREALSASTDSSGE